MGAMKDLFSEITNGEMYSPELGDEVEASELLKLIFFFGDIKKGTEADENGYTVEGLIKEYKDMPTDYIWALIKKDTKYV